MTGRALHDGEVDVWVCGEPAERSDAGVRQALRSYHRPYGTEVRHVRDARGRPVVCGCDDLRVSVSHTQGALVVAVGRQSRVGVDVERVRERGLRRLRHHVLAPSELAELERRPPACQNEVLLGYWTRKEALLKAAGIGLAVEPALIELPPAHGSPHPIAVPEPLGRPDRWWIVELELDGYAAAVAVDAPHPRVRVLPLEWAGARGAVR